MAKDRGVALVAATVSDGLRQIRENHLRRMGDYDDAGQGQLVLEVAFLFLAEEIIAELMRAARARHGDVAALRETGQRMNELVKEYRGYNPRGRSLRACLDRLEAARRPSTPEVPS